MQTHHYLGVLPNISFYFKNIQNEPDYKTVNDGHGYLFCKALRELPRNNLRILLALLPVFFVAITGA